MATRIGLEPTTPSVTGWCSNQLSYRAMIAQVRAASYRGNVLYYIEKSACCQAQICRKCNFLQKQAGWAVWRRQNNFKWSPRCSDHIQRKDYFKFRVWSDRVCAAIKAPVGLLSGRAVCVSRWRGFAPTSSADAPLSHFHERGRSGKLHLISFLCEKGVQESPQTFLNPEIKRYFPLNMRRAQRSAFQIILRKRNGGAAVPFCCPTGGIVLY